ncbi:hypothetical protein N9L47_05690 [Rhodobacteraceae bacterium]|nr:hypothetical protein [Paracoccaceae bacterium]
MKTSPLCSRDDGREIFFTARLEQTKYRVTLSREMLDDICGDDATEKDRKAWVTTHKPEITASLNGLTRLAPYDRASIEETN